MINPLEAARLLGLMLLDGAAALGPFGAYLTDRLGGPGTLGLLAGTIAFWTLVPLGLAVCATHRRDI